MNLISQIRGAESALETKLKEDLSGEDYERIHWLIQEVTKHGKASLAVRAFSQRYEIHPRNAWHWWRKAKAYLETDIQPISKNTCLPILWDQIMDRIMEIRDNIRDTPDKRSKRLWYNQLARFYELAAKIGIAIDPTTINMPFGSREDGTMIEERQEIWLEIEERIKTLDAEERRKYTRILWGTPVAHGTHDPKAPAAKP